MLKILSVFLSPRPATEIACGFFKSDRVNVRILNVALDYSSLVIILRAHLLPYNFLPNLKVSQFFEAPKGALRLVVRLFRFALKCILFKIHTPNNLPDAEHTVY